MNIDQITIKDMRNIVEEYYTAITSRHQTDHFSKDDIKEFITNNKGNDPFNVSVGVVLDKYYESYYIDAMIEKYSVIVSDIIKNLFTWTYRRNYQSRDVYLYILTCYQQLSRILSSSTGKSKFIMWYIPRKDKIYKSVISHVSSKQNPKFTDIVLYPAPDIFNIANITYDTLKEYLDSKSILPINTLLHSNTIPITSHLATISKEEALSKIPSDIK
jgi:hypothetical protein